jgi:hypothetical protein
MNSDAPTGTPRVILAPRTKSINLCWFTSLFLIGLAAKLWFIDRSGTSLPYCDQWDAEAAGTFIPWFEGRFHLLDFFSAHGQHRIFFTRTSNLCLMLLNGQWDNRLECVFNAIVHSFAIAGFGWILASLLGRRLWPAIWLPLVLILVLPFDWENTLWGFQSQFYFLAFFSLLTIWLLGTNEPLSPRWWLGVAAAICSLFTMASGFLGAVAVAALVLLDLRRKRCSRRNALLTLAACAFAAVLGVRLKPNLASAYVFLAHTPGEFVESLSRNLAWPWINVPIFAVFNLLPLAVLAWVWWRSDAGSSPADRMVLGTGLWVLLQAAAIAYARGAEGKPPVSRYMDTFSFIFIADCLSIALLLSRYRAQLPRPGFFTGVFVLWAICSGAGFFWLTHHAWRDEIPDQEFCQRVRLERMREFQATGDINLLGLPGDCFYLPIVEQKQLLRNTNIQSILPSCLHATLQITEASVTSAFVGNGVALTDPDPPTESCWGSYTTNGAGAVGTFESLPVDKCPLPFLEIPVVGDLGQPGVSLELIDSATGRTNAVRPLRIAGGQWLDVAVAAPSGSFKLIARAETARAWFAFKDPRPLGRLSFWAERACAAWIVPLLLGLVFLVPGLISTLRPSSWSAD